MRVNAVGPHFSWGDRLRKVRREIARLSQAEMANLVGVKSPTYSKWEGGGQPSFAAACEVAALIEREFAGQVSAAWMLGFAESPDEGGLLPWMDSNHQPPDWRFDAGQGGAADFRNTSVSYLGHSSTVSPSTPRHAPVSITQVEDAAMFHSACRGAK